MSSDFYDSIYGKRVLSNGPAFLSSNCVPVSRLQFQNIFFFMNSYLACHLTNIVIICTVSVLSEVLIWCYMVIRMRKSKPLDGGNRTRTVSTLQWRHNGRGGVSNHPPYQCVLNRLFRHRSKQTSKLCVTGLCVEFPAQMASNAENVLMTSSSKLQGRVLAPIIGTP